MTDFSKYQAKVPVSANNSGTDFSKYGAVSSPISKTPVSSSLSQNILSDITNRGNNVVSEITNTTQNPLASGVKATGQAFNAISDVAGDVVRAVPGGNAVLDTAKKVIGAGFNAVTNKVADTSLFKGAAGNEVINSDGNVSYKPNNTSNLENTLSTVASGGDVANNILLGEGINTGGVKTIEGGTKVVPVVSDFVKTLTKQSEESIDKAIVAKFEKGIKPTITTKTPSGVRAYRDDVTQAVKTIDTNKPNLSFTDDTGEIITGKNPQTLQQLTDAVEQTKKSVFSQYDSLAKQAGEAGVEVKLAPIANELDTVINSKSLQITSPETIKYAKDLKDRLTSTGTLDATTAQDVIQNYNKSLEAFYRNPSYETASRANVDAMIANNLRKSLDEGISGLTGEQYGALKKQYGSLKTIEKDVVKATLRDARKNVKGLIDFTDVFSGGQVVNGILNLNPGQIASGLAQKGIAEYIKFLNNPNRAIEQMFQAVEKSKNLSSPKVSIPLKQ